MGEEVRPEGPEKLPQSVACVGFAKGVKAGWPVVPTQAARWHEAVNDGVMTPTCLGEGQPLPTTPHRQ